MKAEQLVKIAEYNSVTEAEMARSLLASAQIESEIGNEFMSALYPTGIMPAQLLVAESDAERAIAVLSVR